MRFMRYPFSLSFLINSVNSFSKFFALFLSLGDEGIVKECAPSVNLACLPPVPNKDSNLYCHAMLLLRSYEYLCNEWLFQDSSHAPAQDFQALGPIIFSGTTNLSKSSALRSFNSSALSFKEMPFLWAFLAILAAFS